MDFVLLCHDSDSTVRLFTALRALARTEPLPELWFLDLLHLPNETSGAYNGDRVGELLGVLARWSGSPVTIDAIETATRDLDETRRLLEVVADLRRASPPRLRGSDAFAVAGRPSPSGRGAAVAEGCCGAAIRCRAGDGGHVTGAGRPPPSTTGLEARGHLVGEG